MPRYLEIRNKHIEDKHPTSIASEVTTRKMTDEDWEKYGPKVDEIRRNMMNIKKEEIDPVKKKLTIPLIIELAKKHTLSTEGRIAIAQECGATRIDITNFINRAYVKKALNEAGIVLSPEKVQLVKEIAKSLDVEQETVHIKAPLINPKVELHMNLCADLHETYVAKNTAYGDSFHVTFQEFGIISALTRMSDKWNRIKALATGARNDVKDETLEDSLMDLANYCTLTVMELREQ